MASIRVAAVGSTATRAAASALVTSGADGGEASVRALSEARVSGDDVGRFVLTGPDPPFLPESHQIPSRRLYPGSALANAGTGTGAGQKPRVRRQPRSGPFTADANTNGTSARCEPASRDSVPTRVPAGSIGGSSSSLTRPASVVPSINTQATDWLATIVPDSAQGIS